MLRQETVARAWEESGGGELLNRDRALEFVRRIEIHAFGNLVLWGQRHAAIQTRSAVYDRAIRETKDAKRGLEELRLARGAEPSNEPWGYAPT